jgi:hypothetical protein
MKVKLPTTILLIFCGVAIGWLAFENLMWAIWGKQNRWFEYVGFWGCPILVVSGLLVLKNLKIGSFLGCIGLILTTFYLGPAIVNTFQQMVVGNLVLTALQIAELALIVVLPIFTLLRLVWNLKPISSGSRAEQAAGADSQ